MGDDVVEGSPRRIDVENIGVDQAYVGEVQIADRFLSCFDLGFGGIHPDEPAGRQMKGHRNQISAGGAPEFQGPAVGDRPGGETEQPANGEEGIGMGLGEGAAVVGDTVVGGGRG